MNEYYIVFSPRAQQRLEQIANYLYQQNLSPHFVASYLQRIEDWMNTLLMQFPESGTPMPDMGEHIRRVVFQQYSFVYRINDHVIEILTVYRENQP